MPDSKSGLFFIVFLAVLFTIYRLILFLNSGDCIASLFDFFAKCCLYIILLTAAELGLLSECSLVLYLVVVELVGN